MNKYSKLIFFLFILMFFNACAEKNRETNILANTNKVILLLTKGWDTKEASIFLLEKQEKQWLFYDKIIPAVIGRKGLGVGLGLHDSIPNFDFSSYPQKIEGDGKSPAGIFSISQIYGYDSTLFCQSNMKYTQITSSHHAVDDTSSEFYNQIVDTSKLEKYYTNYYNSFENLIQMSYYYEWFFRIDHNMNNEKSKGSLIFFHVIDKNREGSAGCTTVLRQDLMEILQWADSKTLIIQLPTEVYTKINKQLGLPNINL